MPIIFKGTPGRVLVVKDPAVPARVRPLVQPRPRININEQKSIITRVAISQQTNHQFLHTLGNDIYIYVFGDRVGQIMLEGLSFVENCDGGGGKHGMEQMLKYYKDNKLSSRKDPVQILIGGTTIKGFITGMTNDVVDPKTWLAKYQLTVAIMPEKKGANA